MSIIRKSKKSAKRRVVNSAAEQTTYAIVVSEKVRSFANDPYFVKKANAAKALLEKVGLPKNFAAKAK